MHVILQNKLRQVVAIFCLWAQKDRHKKLQKKKQHVAECFIQPLDGWVVHLQILQLLSLVFSAYKSWKI